MRNQIAPVLSLLLLAGCGDEILRVFPMASMPALPSGHVKLVGDTLSVEMEGSEPLASDYRWVAWAQSSSSSEALGEVAPGDELEVDVNDLATPIDEVATFLITEESADSDLPATPSNRVWMEGELFDHLQLLGLPEASFGGAEAEVNLDRDHVEVTATGLPALPPGYTYDVWVKIEAPHDGAEDGESAEEPMPVHVGQLGGGAFLENELPDLVINAEAAMVTIESENGLESMSPARVLHGAVLLTAADQGAAPEEAEPHTHTH